MVIDIWDNRSADGTNIQLYTSNGTNAQAWTLAYHADRDAYTLTNPGSGKRLDLSNAAIANGCAQLWRITQNSDGTYTFASTCNTGYVVDVANGETRNGTNIQLWPTNGTSAQKWHLLPR